MQHDVELRLEFLVVLSLGVGRGGGGSSRGLGALGGGRESDGDLLLLATGGRSVYVVFGELGLYLTFEYFPLGVGLAQQLFALFLGDPHGQRQP